MAGAAVTETVWDGMRRRARGWNTTLVPKPLRHRRKRRKWRALSRRRRPPTPQHVRRREFEREHQAMRVIVLARDRYCRAHIEDRCLDWSTQAHHILPRARGGPNELWNYVGLCANCHQWVHEHSLAAEARGLLASVGAASPVREASHV